MKVGSHNAHANGDKRPFPLRPRLVLFLVVSWWIMLALQIWFAWDLSEVYSSYLLLLMLNPDRLFGLVGLLFSGAALLKISTRRTLGTFTLSVATLVMAAVIAVWSPTFLWGARFYLWHHQDQFLADVQIVEAAKTRSSHPAWTVQLESGRQVHIEDDPPRIGFERRWIGMFHWAEFVHDRTGDIMNKEYCFGYSVMNVSDLGAGWYLVAAVK